MTLILPSKMSHSFACHFWYSSIQSLQNVAVFLLLTFWLVLDAAVYPDVRTRFATNITGIHRLPPHRTSQVELPISALHPVRSARCQAASGYHPSFVCLGNVLTNIRIQLKEMVPRLFTIESSFCLVAFLYRPKKHRRII